MNEIARIAVTVAVLLPCHEVAAQTFKCTDADGKISYTGKKCSDLGLKDAGEVKDRINTSPTYRPPPRSTSPSPPVAPAPSPPKPAAAAAEPPERRCFTIKTAKGNVTRCGEKQEESDTEK